MVWIFSTLCVGLVIVLIQLLMTYQKRAYDLRMKQEPLRRRIRIHKQAMAEATEKLHAAADARVEELTEEEGKFREQVNGSGRILVGWKKLILDGVEEEEGDEEEEEAEELLLGAEFDPDAEPVPSPAELREQLRQATKVQEELEGHLSGLGRDVDTVRRTLTRLDSKLQRSGAGTSAAKSQEQGS